MKLHWLRTLLQIHLPWPEEEFLQPPPHVVGHVVLQLPVVGQGDGYQADAGIMGEQRENQLGHEGVFVVLVYWTLVTKTKPNTY